MNRNELIETALDLASEAELTVVSQSSKLDGIDISDRYFVACLNEISLNGYTDDSTGSVDDIGHYARIDRWIIREDGQGFIEFDEFEDEGCAETRLEKVALEWEAQCSAS